MENTSAKTKRLESFRKAFIEKAVPFLKIFYNKTNAGYIQLKSSEMCSDAGIDFKAVPTMQDLGLIRTIGPKSAMLYHWKAPKPMDEASYEMIAEKISSPQSSRICSRKQKTRIPSK